MPDETTAETERAASPPLPAQVEPGAGAQRPGLRAFGRRPDDLDVDFGGGRAQVVTEVLRRCWDLDGPAGVPLADDAVWRLPVRVRLHALVVVCLLTGWRALTVTLTCPDARCAEGAELELPLARLADAARQSAEREPDEIAWRGERFRPTLPTGTDLRRWSTAAPSDAEMLSSLGGPRLAGLRPPAELLKRFQEALAQVDPLVDVRVRAQCPGCGAAVAAPVDVEGATVTLLRSTQDELMASVATLARAFGWSERAIVELPPGRRQLYLRLLAEADAA